MHADTIVAVASPPGAGARGVLRLSGSGALAGAGALVGALAAERGSADRVVDVLGQPVPCLVLVMPGPRSYTGEDVVELHLPGSPLLLERIEGALVAGDVRRATPGEFTRRAFENGRLDLAQAEAVLQLIHAAGAEASRRAAALLRGGLAASVARLRGVLQDARALLEAGLDFAEGETGAVSEAEWQPGLVAATAELQELADGLPAVLSGGGILLMGASNAGKSALANALAGRDVVLVDDARATTRDVVAVEIAPGVTVLDAPGDLEGEVGPTDQAALALRARLGERAAAALWVVDASAPVPSARGANEAAETLGLDLCGIVWTKVDRAAPPVENSAARSDGASFAVSSVTGAGIAALRGFLLARGHGRGARDAAERQRGALHAALAAVRAASAAPSDELVAEDLAAALRALDEIDGTSSPEALLDRIFAGFCLGK
ncbi:MAG: GTPase [Planctomycetota bacterium]